VSADTALRLGRYFGTGPELWLNLQSRYDLEVARDRDSLYKDRLGNDWAALDPEHRYFKVASKGNMQSTLKEVGSFRPISARYWVADAP